MKTDYTPLQRVVTALSHQEPDRVPFFLLLTTHGARHLGLSIRDYFARPENVAEGQFRMRETYRHDCFYAFHYAAVEVEAFGGEVIYFDDGPPNAGRPILTDPEGVSRLEPPRIEDAACLRKVLSAIEMLKGRAGDSVPIIGVVMSPFSVPVMQMGFEPYLGLLLERRELFEHLMRVNEEFCVRWANAQLDAGAAAICYFDPVSSPTIVPRELYLETGFAVAKRTLARIKGPTVTHLASGRCLPIVDDLAGTGTAGIGVSVSEDLAEVKRACNCRLSVVGNLNGIEMRHWTPAQAEAIVKESLAKAGPGGGFILSDNHGEIPWQVPEQVLLSISEAVHRWGRYPLGSVEGDAV